MKTRLTEFILFAAAMLSFCIDGAAWGQKGHDVTCAIAARHLTPKAKKQISEILDGKSIVYWANWLDNASHTKEFAYTKTWHYKNIDAGESYENAVLEPAGDVVTAIESQINALKSGKLTKEESATALKILVHLVGDIHCPMHLGHKSDRGGNKWQIQYFNSGKNLHKVWDSEIIESAHKWSHTEWAGEIDILDKPGIAEIRKGSVSEWGKQVFEITCRIYDDTPVGAKLSYDYVNEWAPVIEQQLELAGIRLSGILNEIFK